MPKSNHHTIPSPDSPEYLRWATKLEYPRFEEFDSYMGFSVQIEDPDKAYQEAQKRIEQAKVKAWPKLDLRGLNLKVLPPEIVELKALKVLAIRPHGYEYHQIQNTNLIAALPQLAFLYIEHYELVDWQFLTALKKLKGLYLIRTNIDNLSLIADLTELRFLDFSDTQVSCLKTIKNHFKLQVLDCSETQVTSLEPLKALAQLQALYCSRTQVTSLEPLEALKQLQALYCSGTQVTSLEPLKGLEQLHTLNCSGTQVTSLEPLESLKLLQELSCSYTKVSSLAVIAGLTALKSLDVSGLNLSQLPEALIQQASLEALYCYNSKIANIPSGILSTDFDDNCLSRVRAYFASLKQGAMPVNDIKLMVLGNGQIGKTQLCRRLCGEDFDDSIPSTHGVLVRQAAFTLNADDKAKLNIWDFGGQEIYHGTHSLFFSAQQCVFLLVWHPERENQQTHEVGGMHFRNQPLSYWVEQIKQHNRRNSGPITVIIAQSQCDQLGSGNTLPLEQSLLDELHFCKIITTSAVTEWGLAELNAALFQAIGYQKEQNPQPVVAKSWHRVKTHLEQLISADSLKPERERQNQLLSYEDFMELCTKACDPQGKPVAQKLLLKDKNEVDTLLHLLYHTGTVFYRKGLFNNRILLDQSWALNAIYGVFHRDKALSQIKENKGKFYAKELGYWLWNDDYSNKEQQLFLQMMESCGVCFSYGPRKRKIYVVPELLPPIEDIAVSEALERNWHCLKNQETEKLEYAVDMLHTALFNRVLALVGKEAQSGAVYWHNGLLAFETKHKSWLHFERKMQDDFNGNFIFSARGGDANGLIESLKGLIEHEQRHWSVKLVEKPCEAIAEHHADHLSFSQEPLVTLPEVFISYSWQESSTKTVDEFCQLAQEQKVVVKLRRDINALTLGDCISEFMRRIGRASRIIVILSDAYLKSPNCMFELYEIWRNSKQEASEFREKIRVFVMADAKIFKLRDSLEYAVYWKTEFDDIKAVIDAHGATILGTTKYQEFERIQQFYLNVSEILATISDTLSPQNIDELLAYGLKGIPLLD